MDTLQIQNFGQISNVDVTFGDLTFLIGPQASGKSLSLELLKLLKDKEHIFNTLTQANFVLKTPQAVLDLYFGEGMSSVWTRDSVVKVNDCSFSLASLYKEKRETTPTSESVFYIPAQRILSIADGRPKYFTEFDLSTPYVLRQFSEILRIYQQNGMGENTDVFPVNHQLKGVLQAAFTEAIFHGGKVYMDDRLGGQKKLRLKVDDMSIPFMAWSTGQKEFMPLLMAIYCLIGPVNIATKDNKYKYVIIEEPEMGLHPQAIKSVLLQIIDLMSRGLKVIVSTHSPMFLEFAWMANLLHSSANYEKALYELFDIKERSSSIQKLFAGFSEKQIRSYYFARENNRIYSKDISSLDPDNNDPDIAEWGGLSQFAGTAAELVSKYINRSYE